jgi:predicted RNA binding protein YcfA (HicA-like mRNA interferase family)
LGRLRVLSGTDVCAILASAGFEAVRQRGSHVMMQLRTAESTTTVPVPQHKELKTGTLLSIIRQAGVPRALFEE